MNDFYLSIDVEDWFHAHNLRSAINRNMWDNYELRVESNTHRILDILDEYNTSATFFILGHVVERAPELAIEIDRRGHEVASHGYNHELIYHQTNQSFHDDLRESKEILQRHINQPIDGYRAPSFSITDWALDTIEEMGFEYDSSSFSVPIHDRYGGINVDGDETFITATQDLVEVKLPLCNCFGLRIPWAGGGYFRFTPYRIFRGGLKRIAKNRDYVFYFHPWEMDPDQPKIEDIPISRRIRHYTNLDKTEKRFRRLLNDFDWRPIREGL